MANPKHFLNKEQRRKLKAVRDERGTTIGGLLQGRVGGRNDTPFSMQVAKIAKDYE